MCLGMYVHVHTSSWRSELSDIESLELMVQVAVSLGVVL